MFKWCWHSLGPGRLAVLDRRLAALYSDYYRQVPLYLCLMPMKANYVPFHSQLIKYHTCILRY